MNYDFFLNWTKFKSWDNTEKLYKIENWKELKIGLNKKLDKMEKWTNRKNQKVDKIGKKMRGK